MIGSFISLLFTFLQTLLRSQTKVGELRGWNYLGLELPACHSFPASVEIPIVGESAAQQDNFSEALLSGNLDDRPGSSEFCAAGILGRWCGAAGRRRRVLRQLLWCRATPGRSCIRGPGTSRCLAVSYKVRGAKSWDNRNLLEKPLEPKGQCQRSPKLSSDYTCG